MAKISPGSNLNVPVVTFPEDELPISFGVTDVLFDGEPFPFATVGEWRIVMSQNEVTTLQVGIAVKLGNLPPQARP